MENSLQVFTNAQFGSVRTFNQNGEPWFVGKDVADILGYKDTVNALKAHVDDEDKARWQIATQFGDKEATVINESGLYSLVFASKLPAAKQFKHWVTSEVLPALRKHQVYATPEMAEKILQDPDTIIRILQEIKNEREKRIAAEEKNRADAPKVLFADSVAQAESDILIGELAKLLKQNGVETGQNRLYDRLRKDGYIMKNSTIPTQKAMEAGLFRVIERTIAQPNGTTRITATTKVTGKGQIYFVNKYAKKVQP